MEIIMCKMLKCQDCQENSTLGTTQELSIGIKTPNSPNNSIFLSQNSVMVAHGLHASKVGKFDSSFCDVRLIYNTPKRLNQEGIVLGEVCSIPIFTYTLHHSLHTPVGKGCRWVTLDGILSIIPLYPHNLSPHNSHREAFLISSNLKTPVTFLNMKLARFPSSPSQLYSHVEVEQCS